jgi:tight adherence protein B
MIWVAALIFAAVFATVLGGWYFLTRFAQSSESHKRRDRILGTQPKPASDKTARVALFEVSEQPRGKLIPNLIRRFNLGERLTLLAEQAGVKTDPVRLVHKSLAFFLGGYAAAWVSLPDSVRIYSAGAAAAAAAIPLYSLVRKRSKRLHAFEETFPDTLEFISRSMRAGHAFSVSLEMIHREFPEPLAGEFRRTFEEHNLGLPLDTALQSLSKRVPLLDVQFFVSAVLLQKRTGGNLAEILDKLAYVIRERFKLRGRIKAIAAHGKMTGIALSSIPVGVAALMFFVNPADIRFFVEDDLGHKLAGGAIGLQLVGYLIIRKIVSIEV